MTQRRSGAKGVVSDQRPLAGSSARTNDLELWPLKVHHQVESNALCGFDPGPVGLDFVLPDDDPGTDALLVSGFTWRGVLTIDGG